MRTWLPTTIWLSVMNILLLMSFLNRICDWPHQTHRVSPRCFPHQCPIACLYMKTYCMCCTPAKKSWARLVVLAASWQGRTRPRASFTPQPSLYTMHPLSRIYWPCPSTPAAAPRPLPVSLGPSSRQSVSYGRLLLLPCEELRCGWLQPSAAIVVQFRLQKL